MSRSRIAAALTVAVLGAAAALLGNTPQAFAQAPSTWEIHSRIEAAHERINRNFDRGALSRHDAKRLRDELNAIRDTEARMRQDGRLDRREREILDRKLDRLNKEISAEKRR